MPKINSNIEIDKNCICYGNEVLKISNISRTWIFKFQNKEKKEYQVAKINYEIAKEKYEVTQRYKKRQEVIKYSIMCILTGLVSFYISWKTIIGILLLVFAIICAFITFKKLIKKINYDEEPPKEKKSPNKFGLGIQMNSSYVVVFTAEGVEGIRALKKLQNDIKEADIHNRKTIFNMNEYNVKVEGDVEGIVNFGDDNININKEKEPLNV